METWGPKLPSGWRYPAGRKRVRDALGDLPDIRVRLDAKWPSRFNSPEENAEQVVAQASFWTPSELVSDAYPYVTLYGQRVSDYPDRAMDDFAASVLPRLHTFLRELLDMQQQHDFENQWLQVRWRGDHHETLVRGKHGGWRPA